MQGVIDQPRTRGVGGRPAGGVPPVVAAYLLASLVGCTSTSPQVVGGEVRPRDVGSDGRIDELDGRAQPEAGEGADGSDVGDVDDETVEDAGPDDPPADPESDATDIGDERVPPDVADAPSDGPGPDDVGGDPTDTAEAGDTPDLADTPDPEDTPDLAETPDTPDTPDPTDTDEDTGPSPFDERVIDLSGASPEHSARLLSEAISGLGMSGPAAPYDGDRYFIGRHYIAWLDQTGFHGKMNGLWWLNGASGDALDFAVREPNGRPVNAFVVGERGDGAWPPGYPGSEHAEFPNRTPEPGDDPGCADGDWCNQYSVDEAADYTDPDIPWWRACNAGDRSWIAPANLIETTPTEGGRAVRLVWEARLVKEADGSHRDASGCHEDWFFPDGVRRPVYLRMGYELYADRPWVDRLYQFRNPDGNPPFEGPMSLIGGFVMTTWPDPHPLKALHRYVRPYDRDLPDDYHGGTLRAGIWNHWPDAPIGRDIVYGWTRQPFALSPYGAFIVGATAELRHVGPSDNDDSGFCLCEVHGGTEIGGGLIHGGISLPIAPGTTSIEARRRLAMSGDDWAQPFRRIYSGAELSHGTGRAEGTAWSASTAGDEAGHVVFGPYATDFPAGQSVFYFDLVEDVVDAADDLVATIDVNDATTDEILVSRELRRGDFRADMTAQSFTMATTLAGRGGHRIETRVYWHARAYIRVERIGVYGSR